MKRLSLLLVGVCLALVAVAQPPKRPATLPAFAFDKVDGAGQVTQAQLKPGVATVVLFFDPSCEHCQQQAQWLHSGSANLRNVQFVWVGTAPAPQLLGFREKYLKGSRYTHHVLKDTKYKFDGIFGYSVAPTVLAFDATGKFRHGWSNEVAADDIADKLK